VLIVFVNGEPKRLPSTTPSKVSDVDGAFGTNGASDKN
jgi:hypothetical protein